MTSPRLALARHECGHLVVGLAVGMTVDHVTVDAPADSVHAGRVRWTRALGLDTLAEMAESGDPYARWHARCAAVNLALVAAAGPVADGVYDPAARSWGLGCLFPRAALRRPYPHWFPHDADNVLVALDIAARGRLTFRYQRRVGTILRRYLAARRAVVDDVAALLAARVTLDGDEARAAVWDAASIRGVDVYDDALTAPWWRAPAGCR